MATRIPRRLLSTLKNARGAATMESMALGWNKVVDQSDPKHREQDITEFVREQTKIYRESWIIPQLDEVIKWAEGKDD